MTTEIMSERQIYVASLADYNAGRLHGVWIDATLSPEDIQKRINAMLAESPEPHAEEYEIHDHEGFEGWKPDTSDIKTLSLVAVALESTDEPEALGAFLSFYSVKDIDRFEEAFQGEHGSAEEFVREYYDEQGYDFGPLESYIDWDEVWYGEFECDGYNVVGDFYFSDF